MRDGLRWCYAGAQRESEKESREEEGGTVIYDTTTPIRNKTATHARSRIKNNVAKEGGGDDCEVGWQCFRSLVVDQSRA